MADKYKKRYTSGEALEAIFNDEDSLDEQFDWWIRCRNSP